MSSFPQHNQNIKDLDEMGFDMSSHMESGEATMESWGYDELVDILEDVIAQIKSQDFILK